MLSQVADLAYLMLPWYFGTMFRDPLAPDTMLPGVGEAQPS